MAGVRGRHGLAEPVPLVGIGLRQGWRKLAWGRQKLWYDMVQRQLLPQPILALAQRADPPPDCGHMLADGEVDPLHKGGVDLPATAGPAPA